MRTTTVVRNAMAFSYPELSEAELAAATQTHLDHTQSVLEAFATTHGVSVDNVVSQTDEGTTRITVRSWSDLTVATAWVECVMSGDLAQGVAYPSVIISAQVDPE